MSDLRLGGRLGSPLRDRRSAYLLVGFLAVLVYLNALPNDFAYDDYHIVATNTNLHQIDTFDDALVTPYWPGAYGRELGLWRPVTTLIFGVQHVAADGDPLIFHMVNVLAHLAVSVVLLALLYELLSAPAAFAGALIFAVHPVHVEAVANIVGFSEVLSALAVVMACLYHVRAGPVSSWRSALGIGALYFVAFGAKESGVTLPGLIFVVDAARGRIGFHELPQYLADRWKTYAVMLAVAVALLAGRFAILGSIANPFGPLGADLLQEIPKIWTLGDVWMHYVRLWVFPLDLAADYTPNVLPISISWRPENVVGAGMALLVLGLSLIAWQRPKLEAGVDTSRAAGFGVVWFMIAMSPVSNTLFLSGVLLAERTLYLPSVGLAAATGWLIVRIAENRKQVAWGGLVVAVMLSSVRTWTRNPTWKDTDTVFNQLLEDYPQSGRSQWALGDQFIRGGQVSQGLLSYRAAINLLGTSYQLMTEIASSLMNLERYRGAENILRFAIQDSPQFPLGYSLVTAVRAEQGDAPGTEEWARQSLALYDPDAARHHLLAWSLAAQGRFDEAAEARERGEEIARGVFWQAFMYNAYVAREAGDTAAALAAIDTAWARVMTETGRFALDSVRVAEFGLETYRLPEADSTAGQSGG